MKYFASLMSYAPQAIIPVGTICYIVWMLVFQKSWNFSRLADKEALWIAVFTITTMSILFFYAVLKRIKIPLIEIKDDTIIINETMRPQTVVLWSTVSGLEKHWFFGYRLVAVDRNVSVPIKLLRSDDRVKLISDINTRIKKAHNKANSTDARSSRG
jgi:hypothetical protein